MSENNPKPEVQHHPQDGRFSLGLEGNTAVLEYHRDDNIITFTHTGVPTELEGRGIGSRLARAGLDYAREQQLKVQAVCWFIAGYIEKHPEYQSLLDS
jgi:predicted GNAT family acetyltransferase